MSYLSGIGRFRRRFRLPTLIAVCTPSGTGLLACHFGLI
jgi:hypothetical protein